MKPASICLVLCLSLAACKAKDPTAAVPSGAGSGAATAVAAGAGSASGAAPAAIPATDAAAAIQAALQGIIDKGAYHVTMSASGVLTQVDVKLPDRLRIVAGNMGQIVVIGNDTYSEQNGQWSRISTAASLGDIMKQLVPDLKALVKDPRPLGKEKVDGRDCDVYSYDSEQDLGTGKVKATVKLWIDRESGLPRRQTISGQDPNQPVIMTSDFSFDKEISIEAPTKFNDLGAVPGAAGATTAP